MVCSIQIFIILSNSRLKHVHLNKCISMMKICWLLDDKVISFHLPATACPEDKWEHEHANTLGSESMLL